MKRKIFAISSVFAVVLLAVIFWIVSRTGADGGAGVSTAAETGTTSEVSASSQSESAAAAQASQKPVPTKSTRSS